MNILQRASLAALAFFFLVMILWPMPPEALAHREADSVLLPRFVAQFNEWLAAHPAPREGHVEEHYATLDAGDVRRWAEVRERFKALDAAYKRAGY